MPPESTIELDTLNAIYACLRLRKCQKEFLWTDANNEAMQNDYACVLLDKPESIGRWLLAEIPKRFTWRPEPAELEELCLGKMGLLPPPADEVFAHLLELRREFGPYAVPDPVHLGFMRPGPPPALSGDSLLLACVNALGGWDAVCADDNPVALRAHFTASYGRLVKEAKYQSLIRPDAPQRLTPAPPRIDAPRLTAPGLEDIDDDGCYDN